MSAPKVLSSEQIRSFSDNGYLSPVRVMSAEEAAGYRAQLEAFENAQGMTLRGDQRCKNYLLFTWAQQLIRHPVILDAVEDIYGPDLLIYTSTSWIKEANSGSFVSWHQDSTYFGLEPLDNVTVWLALTPATNETGCMRVLPGSHKLGQLPTRLEPVENNLLSSGQNVEHHFNEADTVEMPLEPGEISMHHTCAIHGSPGNNSNDRRIGIGMHFMPAYVRPFKCLIDANAVCSVTLVRGRQHHDIFPLEAAPESDASETAKAAHAAGVASYRNMMLELGNQTGSRFD